MADSASRLSPYVPRRPDFDDVECGFGVGGRGGGGAEDSRCASGALADGRLREKSGIERLPFFFMGHPG